jgi:hypothetical protein
MIRNLILTITVLAIIFIADHAPRPVKDHQEPFCVITEHVAVKMPDGSYRTGWGQGFGPCRLQDIYREI